MVSALREAWDDRVVRIDVWVSGVFGVVAVLGTVWSAVLPVAVAVDLAMFAAGAAVMLWAFLRGVDRSREEVVSLAGLFFLADKAAPRAIVVWLWGCLTLQTVVAVVTASVRLYSSLAFGVLAPVFGLGMLAVWGAVHGEFPQRRPVERRRRTRVPDEPGEPGEGVGEAGHDT
jgi:hypothetical protein